MIPSDLPSEEDISAENSGPDKKYNFDLEQLYADDEEDVQDVEGKPFNTINGMNSAMYNYDKDSKEGKRIYKMSKPVEIDQIPEFKSINEFQDYHIISMMQRRVTYDQSRFICNRYAEKRADLLKKLHDLTEGIWTKIPELDKRLDYANYINFVVTYFEMFHWLGSVMEKEYENGPYSYIPCQLLDIFIDYFDTVQKAYTSGSVDITNFSFLLYIRDRIVFALRMHFNIIMPMMKQGNVEAYTSEVNERYHPYDYEWLGGSVISGKYQLPFMKFLAINRMQRLELSYYRAVIIATKRKDTLGYLKNIRIPFPQSADNAHLLDKAIQTNESKLRQDFCRIMKVLRTGNGDYSKKSISYIRRTEQFNEICGLVRTRKKLMMDQLAHCENINIKAKLRMIGILATIDAQILIIHRVYALFVDKEKGMYGDCIPESVLVVIADLLKSISEDKLREDAIDEETTEKIQLLRDKVHNAAKIFYTKKEFLNHKFFKESDMDEGPQKKVRFEMDISEKEFPHQVIHHAAQMIWHLQQQKKELKRLHREIHFAREAPKYWPKRYGVDMFRTNATPSICAFASNFSLHVCDATVREVIAAAELDWKQPEPEFRAGVDMVNGVQELMIKYRAVPHCVEIRAAFESEFFAELRNQRINGHTYKQLATEFSMILNQEIDLTHARIRFQSKRHTTPIALRIARLMVRTYMDYVCSTLKVPPRRHRRSSPPPIMDAETREGIADIPMSDINSPKSGSDTESDYATDEGPPGERNRSESESDEFDDEEVEEDGELPQMDPEEAAQVALFLNALAMDGNVLFVESDESDGRVPDDVIDNFIRNFRRVNFDALD